jgi:hypothetical protein
MMHTSSSVAVTFGEEEEGLFKASYESVATTHINPVTRNPKPETLNPFFLLPDRVSEPGSR